MNETTAFHCRTRLLLGDNGVDKLAHSHVLVLGLGGVGGAAAEMLCRAGIGHLTLIDGDKIDSTNRNRQLPALSSTIGRFKTEVVAERLLDINPEIRLDVRQEFVRPETVEDLLREPLDYAVDAVDQLSAKVAFIAACLNHGVPLISSMGSGGKLHPEQIVHADISQTHHCALARAVRRKLRNINIRDGVEVVFSPEAASRPTLPATAEHGAGRHAAVGTISYMPNIFGCYCAAHVVNHLLDGSPSRA